jgi:hypothetical protein
MNRESVDRGYIALLEGALWEKLYGPWLFLDKTGTIRTVSPQTRDLKYEPEQLIGKKYRDFLSSDLYDDALRALAYRIDVARQHPTPQAFVDPFRKALAQAQKTLSVDGKVKSIDAMIRTYEHEASTDPKQEPSEARVTLGDGKHVTVPDVVWLKKYKSDKGWEYAGALVQLLVSDSDVSRWHKTVKWMKKLWSDIEPYQGLPTYAITNEDVIGFDSVTNAETAKHYALKLMLSGPSTMFVLDFDSLETIGDREEGSCTSIITATRMAAQSGKVIIGNARKNVRELLTRKFVKAMNEEKTPVKAADLRFYKLSYPEVKKAALGPEPFELVQGLALETHVEQAIKELENANSLPTTCLPSVREHSEGKSIDVRLSGESTQ